MFGWLFRWLFGWLLYGSLVSPAVYFSSFSFRATGDSGQKSNRKARTPEPRKKNKTKKRQKDRSFLLDYTRVGNIKNDFVCIRLDLLMVHG